MKRNEEVTNEPMRGGPSGGSDVKTLSAMIGSHKYAWKRREGIQMVNRRNFLVSAAGTGLLATLATETEAEGQKPEPAFPKLAIVPFIIEPQPFDGAPVRDDEGNIRRKLSEEATKQAERVLVARRVAATTERVASREAAAGQFVMTGVVRLPLSLPENVLREAAFRRGRYCGSNTLGSGG
jgi:hypothetical protein